jgi:hypothetical protein
MSNLTASSQITQLLHLSIQEQIEAHILSIPKCSRSASLAVDRLLVCFERISGGQR